MLIALAVMLLVFLTMHVVIYNGGKVAITVSFFIGGFLSSILLMIPEVLLIWLAAYVAAMICKSLNLRLRTYALINTAIISTGYLYFWFTVVQYKHEIEEMIIQNPLQSMTERLAYESDAGETAGDAILDSSSRTDELKHVRQGQTAREQDPILQQIQTSVYESQYAGSQWRRRHGLRTLLGIHQGTVSEFQVANGFGVGRMRDSRPRKEFIDLPSPEPVKQPEWILPPYDPLASPPRELVFADEKIIGVESANNFARNDAVSFHVDQIVNFANASGFGYVDRERRQMIGFQSHGFRAPPQWANGVQNAKQNYEVTRLELISLLKHTPAAAYLSDNLPSMEELKSDAAPTRKLDEFEQQAISRLEQGEDLIVAEDQLGLRMVGAIRAVNECLQCHRGREGKLLGGFTYRLKPAKSESDPKSSPAKKSDIPEKQKPLT